MVTQVSAERGLCNRAAGATGAMTGRGPPAGNIACPVTADHLIHTPSAHR
jgi:hypothetical protein